MEKREREEKLRRDAEEKEKLLKEQKQQEQALKKKQDDKESAAVLQKISKARQEASDLAFILVHPIFERLKKLKDFWVKKNIIM